MSDCSVDLRLLEVTEAECAKAPDVLAIRSGEWCFVLQYRGDGPAAVWKHVPVVWIAPGDNDGVIR